MARAVAEARSHDNVVIAVGQEEFILREMNVYVPGVEAPVFSRSLARGVQEAARCRSVHELRSKY